MSALGFWNALLVRSLDRIRWAPLVASPVLIGLSGCWIEENSVWNNSLDPANLKSTGMVYVGGGTFRMGGDTTAEGPGVIQGAIEHDVTLSAFLMDSTEVTQESWNSLMAFNPSRRTDCPSCPIENVTWFEAILYCNARSRSQGLDTVYEWSSAKVDSQRVISLAALRQFKNRNGYRLPSEAEWEYAARGGTSGWWFWGDDSSKNTQYAWVGERVHSVTHPVALRAKTGAGFYDLQGNVAEMTFDWWAPYAAAPQVDPVGPETGLYRVFRGGAAPDPVGAPKNGDRDVILPGQANDFLGFRCVRSLAP